MMDLFRKGFFVGLGAGALAKDQVESLIHELASQSRATAEGARDLSGQVAAQIARELESVSGRGERELEELLAKAGLASRSEVEALKVRVAQLEEQVRSLCAAGKESGKAAKPGGKQGGAA